MGQMSILDRIFFAFMFIVLVAAAVSIFFLPFNRHDSNQVVTFNITGIVNSTNISSLVSLHYECIKWCAEHHDLTGYTVADKCWEQCASLGKELITPEPCQYNFSLINYSTYYGGYGGYVGYTYNYLHKENQLDTFGGINITRLGKNYSINAEDFGLVDYYGNGTYYQVSKYIDSYNDTFLYNCSEKIVKISTGDKRKVFLPPRYFYNDTECELIK